jgi:hypothetical protein
MNNGYTHLKKLHEEEWRRTSHELNEEKSFFFCLKKSFFFNSINLILMS